MSGVKNNEDVVQFISQGSRTRDIFSYPVLAHDHVIYVGPLDYPEEQLDKIQLIRTASPDDTIRLIINSPGGYVSLAMAFISAINESAATIVTHAEGTVASAGTLLWLAGEERTISPMTEFMFHNYQGGTYGDGANMFAQISFAKEYFDRIIRRFYTGVLTEEEIQRIIGGGQVWLDDEQMVARTNATLLSKEYLKKVRQDYGIHQQKEEPAPSAVAVEPDVGVDKASDGEDKNAFLLRFELLDGNELVFDAMTVEEKDILDLKLTNADLRQLLDSLAEQLGASLKEEFGIKDKSTKTELAKAFIGLASRAAVIMAELEAKEIDA